MGASAFGRLPLSADSKEGAARFLQHPLCLLRHYEELDEGYGLRLVDHVHQEGPYNGDDHEGFPAHAVFVFDGGHVHDGGGGGSQPVAAEPGAHDGCVIIASQDLEDHEPAGQDHEHHLGRHNQHYAAQEPGQLPQPQGHKGDGQVQVQHHISDAVHQGEIELIEMVFFIQVPEDHGGEHGPYIGGEAHVYQFPDPAGDHGADGHAAQDGGDVLDNVQGAEFFLGSGVDFFHIRVEVFRGIRFQMVLFNEHPGYRAPYQHRGDETEGGGGHAHFQAGRIAHGYEGLPIGGCGAVAPDHGNGAGQESIGGFNAEDLGKGDADYILTDGDDAGYQPVDDQQGSAFFQQGDAGAQAYGGEEGQHKGILEIGVEFESVGSGLVADEGDEHEQESSHYRSRDAVFPEGGTLPLHPVSQKQHNGCQGGGKNGIRFESQDIFQHNDGHGTSLPF